MPIQGIGQFSFLNTLWKGFQDGSKRDSDQIAQSVGSTGLSYCLGSLARLFGSPLPTRLHTGPAICDFSAQAVLPNRLSWHYPTVGRLAAIAKNTQTDQTATLYNNPESPSAVAKKRAFERLQTVIFKYAARFGLIGESTEASIDSTGLESHLVSRHFLMRQGKRTQKYRRWTKLTIVCEHNQHLITGATVSLGPNNDAPWLPETIQQAVQQIPIHRLLADSGYDSEKNHHYCRKKMGIRSTVIAVNDRYYKGGPLKGHYRKQMKERFPKQKYKQRWQVESVFSRFKRRLGYALRSQSHAARKVECLVRVLTYNLMILYLISTKSNNVNKYSLRT